MLSPLRVLAFVAAVLSLSASGSARAAETAHITLTLDGADVPGDSSLSSLGRANTIECMLFRTALRSVPAGAGRVVQAGTMTCRKPVDRATPLLVKGLVSGAAAEMTVKFYRPNPIGDGTTQQYYSIVGHAGRVVAVKQLLPDTLNVASATLPIFEEVTFEFTSVTFSYVATGVDGTWP